MPATNTTKASVAAPTPGLDLNPPTESTALAVPDSVGVLLAVSATAAEAVDLDNLDDLDLAGDDSGGIPVIRMSRKNDGTGGIEIGGVMTDAAEFIWAGRAITRARFPKSYDEDPGSRPDCWSSDGRAPSATIVAPKHTSCAGCPFSFEATGGKRGPDGTPGCGKNMEALVYLPETGPDGGDEIRVARIRFGGLAFAKARGYWESFAARLPKKYPVRYVTRMTLEPTKTDNGIFLVPAFTRVSELSGDQAAVFVTDARARMAGWQQVVSDDIAAGARTADPVADPAADPFSDEATATQPPIADSPTPAAPGERFGGRPVVDVETGEVLRPAAPPRPTWALNTYDSDSEPF